MLNFIRNISIKSKLLLAFSIIILLSVSINTIFSYYRMVRFTEDKWGTYAKTITQQINTTFDNYFKNIDYLSCQIAYNDTVQYLIKNDYTNKDYEYGVDSATAFRFLEGMRKTVNGVDCISIYQNSDRAFLEFSTGHVNPNYKIIDETWFNKVESSNGEKVLVGPYNGTLQYIQNNKVISLVRKIRDLGNVKILGYIVVEVNISDMLANYYENIEQDKENIIYITNEEGRIIYNNINKNAVGAEFEPVIFSKTKSLKSGSFQGDFHSKPSLITFYTSSFTNWKVLNVTSRDELIREITINRNNSIVVGVIFIVVSFAFSIILSNGIVKPIRKLKKMIRNIEEGNFGDTVKVTSKDEIGVFAISFNRMSIRLKELVQEIYTKEEEKRKAEIVALQAQINPHFTYNTLAVIKQMAVIQKAKGISKTVDSLINLLQASAKYKDGFITVEQELNLIKSYIYIQETRYCGKFSVEFDYDEAVLGYKTLNLLLQPITENAILHGVSNISGIGKITIHVGRVDNSLQYIIEDNGVGMTQEQIDEVMVNENKNNFDRIGIYNVNKRIKLYFGESYGIEISRGTNGGTRVKITIPLI